MSFMSSGAHLPLTHPDVGELHGQLDEGVWADAAFLHGSLAKLVVHPDVDLHIVDQALGHLAARLDDVFQLD